MVIIAKYSNTVEYKLKTTLDSSGISKLQAEIKKTQTELKKLSEQNIISDSAMGTAQAQLSKFSKILNQSFNSKIGMLDLSKVNKLMGENALSIGKISTAFSMAGTKGEVAFNNILGRVGKIDTGLKSMTKTTDKIMNTFGNTVRWGVIASGFQSIMNSAHEAVQYVKDLDTSLTNIMMVTDYSKEQMNEYAKSANEAAKALGSTTVAMTDATLVFAQQGFDLNKSDQLAQLSTKLANASQQDTATTSDQITAYMNAYGLDSNIEKLSSALDSWAEVANVSAADVQELATASQKAASTANTVGVNMDQLAAQIATIESVTREAPENIGNGLKTIYARFSDIAMGDTLDDGVNLGTVTGTLEKVGVSVLGSDGKMRQVGAIMEDLMKVWSNIDSTQKNAIATTLAGKYQLARFEALMNRSDMYNEYKNASQNAEGTLDVMNEKYVNSLEGRMNKLQATFEGMISKIFESDDFYGFIDGITTIIDLVNQLTESIGGGASALTGFGTVLTKVFSGSITNSIYNFMSNRKRDSLKKSNAEQGQAIFDEYQMGTITSDRQRELAERVGSVKNAIGQDEASQAEGNKIIEKAIELDNLKLETEDKLRANVLAVNEALKIQLGIEEDLLSVKRNEDGVLSVDRSKLTKKLNTDGKAYEKYDPYNLPDTTKDKFAKKSFLDKRLTGLSISEDTINIRDKFDSVIDGYTDKFDGFKNSLKNTTTDLKTNVKYVGMLGDEYETVVKDAEKIASLLDNKNSLIDINDEELEKIRQIINELESINTKVNDNLEEASNTKPSMKTVNETESELSGIGGAERRQKGDERGFKEDKESKDRIHSIVDATAAVGDLTFAWQSFQSLGSLWQDKDVTSGEKLVTTIQNVALTAPAAISGIVGMKDALTALGLTNPAIIGIGVALGVLAAGATAFNVYTEQQKQARDDEQKKLESVKKSADEAVSAVSNWKTLYDTYKKTGEVSEEFRNTSLEVAKQLGVEGAAALDAAKNYDALAIAIKNKKDKELQNEINENKRAITTGAIAQSLKGDALNGSILADRNQVGARITGIEGSDSYDQILGNILESSGFYKADTASSLIASTNAALESIHSQQQALGSLDEYKKKVGDTQSAVDTWTARTQSLNNAETELNNLLKQQDLADYSEAISNMASARVQQSDFISEMNKAGNDIGKIQKLFKSDSSTSGYMESISDDWNKQLQFMIDSSQDATQKIYLQAQQAMYQAAVKARQTTGSDEQADEVYKKLNSSGLTDKQKVALVASLDENETFQNFDETIKKFKESPEGTVKLSANIDTESLKKSIDEKQNFQKLVDSYQKNGNFSEDEVASLIKDNPEYLDYLTKVGDTYQLNTDALNKWNEAVEKQRLEIEDAQGEFNSNFFNDYQSQLDSSSNKLSLLSRIYQEKSTGSDGEQEEIDSLQKMSDLGSTVKDISQQLEDGKISVEDYFSSFEDAFNSNDVAGVFSNIKEYSSQGQEAILEMASVLQNGLANGVNQATKQLKTGNISLTDYSKILQKATETSIDYQAGLKGLKRQGKQWINIQSDMADEQSELTEEQEDWIDSNKDVVKSLDDAEAANGMNDALSDNYDYLSQIIDEYGNLTIDWDSIAGTEQFSNTVSQMAEGISQYINSSQDNLTAFAAAMGMTTDEFINNVGTSSYDLASYMMENEGNFSGATQAMMTSASSGIGQLGAAAGEAISALGELISGFEGSIEVSPGPFSVESTTIPVDIFGKHFDLSIPLPSFSVNVKGSLTGGSAEAAKKLSDSLSSIGSGISGLTNVGGAMSDIGLSDWKPGGSGAGVSSDAFTNPGGRSGGSGGSGGGGGGGGGSSYEPKTKDRNDDELDRYKKVDAQLNKIDKTLDKLNTDKERLVGYKWQNAMAKEIKLLYKQIDLQKEKLELQKEEAEEKRNQLANDYGITFDADGIPQNYKEKFQELQNSLNDAIDAYNNSTTEEDQNYWEDIIEQRQKAFDDFKDLIDKYLDVQIDGIEESEKNIKDFYDKIEDMRIEAFNKQIESVKTIKDINDAWIEFQQIGKGRSDDVFRVGDTNVMKLANAWQLSNENMDEYYDNLIAREQKRWHETDDEQEKANAHARAEKLRELKANALAGKYDGRNGSGLVDAYIERGSTLSDQIKQMEETGTSSIYGENSKQLYEDAEEFVKDYVSYVKDIEQAQEAVFQSIMDGIDQINDWMNERLDQYDNIIQRLDHQANLVEALRGEESYDELNNIYQAQNANYDAQMTEVKQNIATWENLKKTLKEGSDQWKEVNNKIVESQQKLDDLVESSIENLQKIYENTVKKSLKTWTSNLFNGESDIDWVADQWELINRNADYYLDSTNKAYNIQKLQTKYLDLLDNASGLNTQHKITEQMNQQLDLLRNKTKLSQYDVEYANAQLEILQKQIALEDAQRNKSQMKLRRDSQGNYSYVYTANEDNVRSAENDLLDSKNNAYNLSKDQIKQTQSDALSAYQEAFSQIETIKNSAIGKTEEGKQRIQKILDELKEYLNGVGEQLSTAQGNILYDFTSMVDSLSQENKAGVEDIADQIKNGNDEAFSAIDSRWNASFTKWLLDSTNFEKAQKKLLSDFNNATSNWQVNVNKIATKVGEDFNDVSKTVNKCTDATNELAKSTEAFYQKCDEGVKKIGGWQGELTNYQKMLASLKDETSEAYKTIEKLTNQIKDLETKNANQAAVIEYMKHGGSSGGSGSGSGGDGGDSIDPSSYRAGDSIGYTGQYYNDSYGDDPVGSWYSGEQGAVRISSFSGEPYGHPYGEVGEYSVHIETPNGGHLGWIRPDQMFDTGGYTGDWDNGINEAKNGKLAFLHQKELVLNETDTANILNAVNMIRAMTDGLKSGALNSALSSINSFSGMNSQSSQDLEQNIHIDANFPNVKDASEIEQAILSLADQATQYIHKIR